MIKIFLYLIIIFNLFLFADNNCIKLKQIDLSSNKILDKSTQQEILHKFYGQCITQKLLKNILTTVTGFYMDQGYITTKAYLKEQDIKDGQLDIEILQGKIEDIIHNETNTSSSKIATAFIFQKGKVLNLRDLETSLEMINRPSSADAKFEIAPGTKEGESIVRIKTKSTFPIHLQLGLSGSKSFKDKNPDLTGVLTIDNLFNLNDILNITYNGSRIQRQYQSTDGKEINYSFPIGSYLLEFIRSYSSYKQGVKGLNDTYLAEGDTVGTKVQISKILTRNQTNKLKVQSSIYHKNTRNYFADELIEVSSYKTTLAQIDLIHTYLQNWGQLVTTYSYYHGEDWFGARDDGYSYAENDYATEAKLQFQKYTLESALTYYFPNKNYRLNSTFYMQYARDHLFNNDQISVGSDYTVRGYGDSNLIGDSGFYIHNDLFKSFDLGTKSRFLEMISPYIGFDYGKVKCQKDNPDSCGILYGSALGVQTSSKNLTTNFMWSKALKELITPQNKNNYFKFDVTFNF